MERISLLITGGTIDKVYDEGTGTLIFTKTNIPKILKTAKISTKVDFKELMLVDSLNMTKDQRNSIISSCSLSKNSKIVITHGTDTMVETAKEIASKNLNKTIIITGAMIPYALKNSDSTFNLANALAYVLTLKAGVYIVMNGRYFHWDNVQKNKTLGIFETVR
jgi:L-asparaginase